MSGCSRQVLLGEAPLQAACRDETWYTHPQVLMVTDLEQSTNPPPAVRSERLPRSTAPAYVGVGSVPWLWVAIGVCFVDLIVAILMR